MVSVATPAVNVPPLDAVTVLLDEALVDALPQPTTMRAPVATIDAVKFNLNFSNFMVFPASEWATASSTTPATARTRHPLRGSTQLGAIDRHAA
jgi:hypothetical protein